MKLFIDIVMKRIYLFNIVAWNYRKKIWFPVCKKENFAGLQAHRKRGKSARASPTPHHTLNEERSARFTAQHLSALLAYIAMVSALTSSRVWRHGAFCASRQHRRVLTLCLYFYRFRFFAVVLGVGIKCFLQWKLIMYFVFILRLLKNIFGNLKL